MVGMSEVVGSTGTPAASSAARRAFFSARSFLRITSSLSRFSTSACAPSVPQCWQGSRGSSCPAVDDNTIPEHLQPCHHARKQVHIQPLRQRCTKFEREGNVTGHLERGARSLRAIS